MFKKRVFQINYIINIVKLVLLFAEQKLFKFTIIKNIKKTFNLLGYNTRNSK